MADLPEMDQETCPICGGDCASANPPMVYCSMQEAREFEASAKLDEARRRQAMWDEVDWP